MKKLAIIGSSNAVIKNGYAAVIKKRLGDNCDIYSLGSTASSFGIIMLLSNQIINNYQYVILEFSLNDTDKISQDCLNIYTLAAYTAGIVNLFTQSKSIPIFLNLPYLGCEVLFSSSWIISAFCRICNIKCIDMEEWFEFIEYNKLAKDNWHCYPQYQNFIGNKILESLSVQQNFKKIESTINFNLLEQKYFKHLPKCQKSTSLLKKDVWEINGATKLLLPNSSYLTAILYWIENNSPYFQYSSESGTIIKNINIVNFKKMFCCRSVGYTISSGLAGGEISATWNYSGKFVERTMYERERKGVEKDESIYINSVLMCDRAPVQEGLYLLQKYKDIFEEEREKLVSKYLNRHDISRKSIFVTLDEILPSCSSLFRDVLTQRPDLALLASVQPYAAETLLLWGWKYGRNEMDVLATNSKVIKKALTSLITPPPPHTHTHTPPPPTYTSGITGNILPRLVIAIWNSRNDLQHMDITTPKGQEEMSLWFKQYGHKEYGLDEIL